MPRVDWKAPIGIAECTDAQLEIAYDNALADWGLAYKYDHNSHLIPAIRNWLDELHKELERRKIDVPYITCEKDQTRCQ